ncbi:unnamed protein product [Haemonchus placei]|uniref:ZP domain-containing protein n=1 Tax=Haemonchus placei TaxID=6290 RepID=A0A0N4WJS3_HAEPC|nr:unnamed protein product [Haemonchus placei]
MRSILLILSIASCGFGVKPIWRTPVTDVRKNATSRTQRASFSVPLEGLPGYVGQKQVPYYTRPEDFKIPDYRPAKPNAFQPNFQPGFQPNFRPNNFQPNPQQTNLRPFFIPNQFIPQQFIPQQFRPLNQGNNFVGQPPFNPNYRTGPQYPGNRVVYPPPQSAFPVVNNGRNQWFVPQSAFPYLEGSGPVPPQGIYGPTTTSYVTAPQVPSVNPQNYQGTLPTQPSANPERITTPTIHRPLTDMVPNRTTKGWYNPTSTTSTASRGETTTTTSTAATDRTSGMRHIFISETDSISSSSSNTPTSSSATATPSGTGSTRQSVDEELLKVVSPKGPIPPPVWSTPSTGPSRPTTPSSEFPKLVWSTPSTAPSRPTATSSGFSPPVWSSSSAVPSRPVTASSRFFEETEETEEAEETEETTPEYNEEIYDHSEQFVEKGTTKAVQQTKVSPAGTTYVPRPIATQGYQPPGHLPEDFSKHIDVSFLKPTPSTCVGPLCGVDVDKVSLYKPESAEAGHRPTLLISNAAKGDAARLGYIPPPPKPVSEFGPLPPEYNYSRPYPGYRPVFYIFLDRLAFAVA